MIAGSTHYLLSPSSAGNGLLYRPASPFALLSEKRSQGGRTVELSTSEASRRAGVQDRPMERTGKNGESGLLAPLIPSYTSKMPELQLSSHTSIYADIYPRRSPASSKIGTCSWDRLAGKRALFIDCAGTLELGRDAVSEAKIVTSAD